MITSETLLLPKETVEAVRRGAEAAHMSVPDYVRSLVEADSQSSPDAPSFNDRLLDEHRSHITSSLTNEDVLAARQEERPE
ncbi:hypothetical protein [Thermobifida cellulosilytica]|jgi:hypothetical protein|nr:hypothetical protein [Thermobifida cellulosilytica]